MRFGGQKTWTCNTLIFRPGKEGGAYKSQGLYIRNLTHKSGYWRVKKNLYIVHRGKTRSQYNRTYFKQGSPAAPNEIPQASRDVRRCREKRRGNRVKRRELFECVSGNCPARSVGTEASCTFEQRQRSARPVDQRVVIEKEISCHGKKWRAGERVITNNPRQARLGMS